jgi:UDP-N-acetylglucosamine--N-acetylmuramyl-(pentapeptide) pyrophosphoryl-undecaprenol N-acetylglucosamine transferase
VVEKTVPMLVIAGGGTGGHVAAGVAVAQEWERRFGKGSVAFVGARGGIEERLVPRAGFPLHLLKLGSLNRVSLSTRLRTFALLPGAFLKSAWILMKLRPVAVFGVGGYASGPLVLLGRILGWMWAGLRGCQVAILEQNAAPGFTNRILARFARQVLVAFEGIEKAFPGRSVAVTGNPVRSEMVPLAEARTQPFTVFIFGGSQGAKGVNTLVLEMLPRIQDLRGKVRFIHQTGELDFERVREGHQQQGFSDSRVEKFIYGMLEAYRDASLVVCRSGSSSLAELAAVGRAALLIPFPYASDNHQEKNARIFEARKAAEVLVQFDSQPADLEKKIREFVETPARVRELEVNIRSFYRPHAARDIVDCLETRVRSQAR